MGLIHSCTFPIQYCILWLRKYYSMTRQILPRYKELIDAIRKSLSDRPDVAMETIGLLHYDTGRGTADYPYYKIFSNDIGQNDPIVLIRACIHGGEEPAGALTIMEHAGEIFDYAHERGVKLIIFPLDNPSGFERGLHYNMENDLGEGGNNDFIRHELFDGRVTGDIVNEGGYKGWCWASDPELGIHLPKETAILHAELKKLPLERVNAVLDIHQDQDLSVPGAYHYAFGDKSAYRPIVEKIEKETRIFKNIHKDRDPSVIAPGFVEETVVGGVLVPDTSDPVTDDLGFIEQHDCSLTDLFFHLGARHSITVETIAVTPLEVCDRVNMIWIRGLIDLIEKEK